MNAFNYKSGVMHAESVSLASLAAELGTPFYCYSEGAITKQYCSYVDAFTDQDAVICYAMKANDNLAVLRTFAELGAGADVVSGGELQRALAAGIPPAKIIFSGVGKTEDELALALSSSIMQINIESFAEMELLSRVANTKGVTAEIAIRINPNVDAKTHDKIATGRKQDKFGINIEFATEAYRKAAALPGLDTAAVAVHIGSQLTSLDPFEVAFARVAELVGELRSNSHDIRRVDLGGGLGITYDGETPPTPIAYANVVKETVGDLGCRVLLEPGRNLVGNAGVLVTQVIYTKEGDDRDFVIVDAAMNDLIRPALYDAYHGICPVIEPAEGTKLQCVDVVGPICETGDTFTRARNLPLLSAGDLLVFNSAGAYCAVMSSTYNARPHVPEVLVREDQFSIVRARQTIEDILRAEKFAVWQTAVN